MVTVGVLGSTRTSMSTSLRARSTSSARESLPKTSTQ